MDIRDLEKLVLELGKTEGKIDDIEGVLKTVDCLSEDLGLEMVEKGEPVLAVFDLETTDLNGEFGSLVCGSILSLPSGKMTTFRQDQLVRSKKNKVESMLDDRELACKIRDELNRHVSVCGWYSKGFDWPFLNTRLFLHKEEQLEPKFHIDSLWYAKGWRGIKLRNGKLDTMAKAMDLGEHKLEVSSETWLKARHGDKAANDIVQERCEGDVRLTHKVTERMFKAGLIRKVERYG